MTDREAESAPEAEGVPRAEGVPQAEGAPEAPPAEPIVVRPYDLPGPRKVVISGLQLAAAGSGELRRASLYIGLLTLAILGPVLVDGLAVFSHFKLGEIGAFGLFDLLRHDASAVPALLGLELLVFVGVFSWLAVTIDAQLIAVSLLAARASERAFTLREATIRARQVFWRFVGGGVLVGLATAVLTTILRWALGDPLAHNQGTTFLVAAIGVLLASPFGYLGTGIVLGDVGPVEALKRSVRLARTKPSIAIVVALFTLVTAAIQTFALSAGLDVLIRAGEFLHLEVGGSGLAFAVIVLGLLAFLVAVGSLTFTVSAIVLAPQVAAFLGLTFYSGGLDRVRTAPGARSRFLWITWPMLAVVVLLVVVAAAGVSSLR
jgi:hypothetical protein